jgi:hypothetical protein
MGFVGVIANYVFAQGAGLIIQSLTMAFAGPAVSGAYGLALMTVNLSALLGDLGYGFHFLRDLRVGTDAWRDDWRIAQGHRLLFLLFVSVLVLIFWPIVYGVHSLSWNAMLFALPGILLSYFNFSSVLFARGETLLGNLGRVLAAVPMLLIAAAVLVFLRGRGPDVVAVGLGAAITVGQAVQAVFYLGMTRGLALYRAKLISFIMYLCGRATIVEKSRQRQVLKSGGAIWALVLVGTVHGSLPQFFVAAIWPPFLPYMLLVKSICNGLTGVQDQLARVLVPKVSGDRKDGPLAAALPLVSNMCTSAVALGLAGIGLMLSNILPHHATTVWHSFFPFLLLVLLDWVMGNVIYAVLPVMLARKLERQSLAGDVVGNSIALLLTIAVLAWGYLSGRPGEGVAGMLLVRSLASGGVASYIWTRLKLPFVRAALYQSLPVIALVVPAFVAIPANILAITLSLMSIGLFIWVARELFVLLGAYRRELT